MPPAVPQEALGGFWGSHSTQGAQHVVLTPAHCGHRVVHRYTPFEQEAWHLLEASVLFHMICFVLHLCNNIRTFQEALEWLLPLLHTCRLAVRCCQGPCSAQHSTAWVQLVLQKSDQTQTSWIIRAVLQNPLGFQRDSWEGRCIWKAGLGWRI